MIKWRYKAFYCVDTSLQDHDSITVGLCQARQPDGILHA
jgi:hypothetical protein